MLLNLRPAGPSHATRRLALDVAGLDLEAPITVTDLRETTEDTLILAERAGILKIELWTSGQPPHESFQVVQFTRPGRELVEAVWERG